jgi:hypothetical protein
MPAFDRATISTHTQDLTEYSSFLRSLAPGQEVRLPLDAGESPRAVARSLNLAAAEIGIRLQHRPRQDGAVRFRVLSGEKRTRRRGQPSGAAHPQTVRADEAAPTLNAVPKPARRGRPRKTAE